MDNQLVLDLVFLHTMDIRVIGKITCLSQALKSRYLSSPLKYGTLWIDLKFQAYSRHEFMNYYKLYYDNLSRWKVIVPGFMEFTTGLHSFIPRDNKLFDYMGDEEDALFTQIEITIEAPHQFIWHVTDVLEHAAIW